MNLTAAFAAREGDFPLYGFCGGCWLFSSFRFNTAVDEGDW